MVFDFTVGFIVSLISMFIHLLATIIIAKVVYALKSDFDEKGNLFLSFSLTIMYLILSVALFASVTVWGLLFYWLGLVDNFGNGFYSALVSYTTLGFGDASQMSETRLVGPMAAASGILMFSWAAAVLIYVLQAHLPYFIAKKDTTPSKS